jgi:hypothetical protein
MINQKIERIGIWGVPRSGTSWLGQIFNSSAHTIYRFQPLFSYAFKHGLSEFSSKSEIDNFFHKISISDDDFVVNGMLSSSDKSILSFKKKKITHIVMKHVRYLNIIKNLSHKCDNIKLIGIVRNPCAVLYSWFNAEKEFRKDWKPIVEWKNGDKKNLKKEEEFFGYDKWKQAALLFEELNKNKNFFLVNYNNLLSQTNYEIQSLFKFTNIDFTQQTINFIEKSKNTHLDYDYSVFKKKTSDSKWKDGLPKEIINYIRKDLRNTVLEKYLK